MWRYKLMKVARSYSDDNLRLCNRAVTESRTLALALSALFVKAEGRTH